MPRHQSLFTIVRKNLLDRADGPDPFDPFRPLEQRRPRPAPLSLAAPVGPPGLPISANRPDDIGRVETALSGAGFLGLARETGQRGRRRQNLGVFDSRLESGIRAFQRRHKLKADGLLLPKGPTRQALNRILERAAAKTKPAPPLKHLSGEAVSANARLVRHLMGTTADGLVPGLMAGDFRADQAGRAKTADFLSQLFARDPARVSGP